MPPSGIIWSETYTRYKLGDEHPMHPRRLVIPFRLFESLNFFKIHSIKQFEPQPAPEADILRFHTPGYVQAVKDSAQTSGNHLRYGLGTGDCPVFPEMHEISRIIVGGALEGVKRIQNGDVKIAFSLLGGLHHAFAQRAAGFCYYNDVVIIIKYLKEKFNLERILYIDTDVHAGDGVLDAFYEDQGVLGISIHESPQFIFPATGFSNEIGEGIGRGYTINVPIFPATWDDLYIKMFEKVVPCLSNEFDPEFVIWQCGADGHYRDYLGHLNLTTKTYQHLGQRIAELSQQSRAEGKLLMLGGGGYNPDSVARVWLTTLAAVLGKELPTETPEDWRQFCENTYNIKGSTLIHDPPVGPQDVDRPALVEEANTQYLQVLREELQGTGIWENCVDLLISHPE
ncbi:MAG: acetoin utilization protein AcuC [Candidatus Thorarchaeota archaeon]